MARSVVSAAERRRTIRAAAVRVFARAGFHDTRVSDIAAEAGVAHGLVYHYFESKEALLQEIFRRTWTHLVEGLRRLAAADAPAARKLAEVVRLMLGSYRLDPDLVRVLVLEVTRSGNLRDEVEEIRQGFEVIEQIIRDGQQRGELRSDVSPALASYLLWGAIDEVISAWVFGTLPDDDAQLAQAEAGIVAVVIGGLTT